MRNIHTEMLKTALRGGKEVFANAHRDLRSEEFDVDGVNQIDDAIETLFLARNAYTKAFDIEIEDATVSYSEQESSK